MDARKKKLSTDRADAPTGKKRGGIELADEQKKEEDRITNVCIKIAHYLNYTIEQVLDHDIDWINHMAKYISIDEFEKNMFELAAHGVELEKIEKLKRDFYAQIDPKKNRYVPQRISIAQFRMMGLSVGKENKTVVKR